MSVSKPYRKESSAEFLNKAIMLNEKIGTFVVKLPVKYKIIYGDDMARTGLEALRLLQTGNGIYLSKDTPAALFLERQSLFMKAKGYIYNIPTTFFLCTQIWINVEQPDNEKREKMINRSKIITDLCNECVNLISALILSDRKRYKEYQNS